MVGAALRPNPEKHRGIKPLLQATKPKPFDGGFFHRDRGNVGGGARHRRHVHGFQVIEASASETGEEGFLWIAVPARWSMSPQNVGLILETVLDWAEDFIPCLKLIETVGPNSVGVALALPLCATSAHLIV